MTWTEGHPKLVPKGSWVGYRGLDMRMGTQ